MHRFLLTLSTAMLLGPIAANAADLDLAPIIDWSGVYGGFNGSYSFGGEDKVGLGVTGLGGGQAGDLSLNGFSAGLQAGYNYQINYFVLGLEADIQRSDINDSDSTAAALGNFDSSSDINYFGTLRGRIGLAVDNFLVYGTGGLAAGNVEYSVTGTSALPSAVDIGDTSIYTGYALGAGAEYGFEDGWSLKAEYLYVNLGSERLSDGGGNTTVASPDFHSIRLGVNFIF